VKETIEVIKMPKHNGRLQITKSLITNAKATGTKPLLNASKATQLQMDEENKGVDL